MRNQASILVGLLWCVALLALVVVSALHTATMDLKVAKNYGDKIQAHYLALAGIEKARALLYQAARNRGDSGTSLDRQLFDAPGQFRAIPFGRGEFSVFHRESQDEGGGVVFGVSDEESRLNINTATAEALTNISGMSVDIAAAILAWRGQASDTNVAGANADYYASLQPPYQPRNGPFQTIRELLMVRGVTPELLFGSDARQNGFLPEAGGEPGNASGTDSLPQAGDGGWAAMMTVDSSVANLNAAGARRVNIQNADETELAGVTGITPALARAIVQYRGQHPYQSIADLLDVTTNQNQTAQAATAGAGASGQTISPNGGNAGGPQLIDENLLTDIADDVTVDATPDEAGLLNINTASLDALLCLPGMDRERAQAVYNYARSQGAFANIAWLLKVPRLDRDLFKQVAPLVTARSETFRILSEGRVKSTGVSQRIQVIVRINRTEALTLSWREDNL
jgi:DNA uptake protein ComE-like DNA-binding protein